MAKPLGYLLALLVATSLAFTTLTLGPVVFRGSPALAGGVGVLLGLLLLRRFRRCHLAAGFWPVAGLALGRTASWLATGADASEMTLVGMAGPVAYLVFSQNRSQIPQVLRAFGLVLVAVQVAQLLGRLDVINPNLLAHLLLICLAAYLPDGASWRGALVLAAMLSTTSKGAAIGAAAAIATYHGVSWAALPAGAGAAALLYQLRRWDTIGWRLTCWAKSALVWLQSPLFGAGPGIAPWPEHAMGVHAHNLILGVLSWTGISGLGMLGAGLWPLIRARGRLVRWAWCGLAGILAHYMVDDFTGSALCLALVAALLAAATSGPAPPAGSSTGRISLPL